MFRVLVSSLGIPAVAATTVVPVALATSEWSVASSFAVVALVTGLASFFGRRQLEPLGDVTTVARLSLVAVVWILIAVVMSATTFAAVFVAPESGGAPELSDLWSAAFESVSGVSTTGLSMLGDSAAADPWLQWWRSVLQWIGAIGVVGFAAMLAEPSGDHDALVESVWADAPGSGAVGIVRRLVAILATITAVAAVGLLAAGEPVWHALNHAMTAAATGGFSVTSDSASTMPAPARIVLAVSVLAAATSFGTIWDRSHRSGVPLWRRTQVRYSASFTVGIAATALLVSPGVAIGDVIFNSVSASTTAGFSTGSSFRAIPALGALTMLSMFIGGAAGSTAGGLKVARAAWLVKAAARWLPGDASPEASTDYRWDGERVEADVAQHRMMGAGAIATTWVVVVLVASLIVAAHHPLRPLDDVVFETLSAASNAGLSSGLVDADSDAATKATLSMVMLAGRVEMTAFVALLFAPVARVVRH